MKPFNFYPTFYLEFLQNPAAIKWHQTLYSLRSTHKERVLAVLLIILSNDGPTYVTNKKLAFWLSLSDRQIRRMLSKLAQKNIIFVDHPTPKNRIISSPLKGGCFQDVHLDYSVITLELLLNEILSDIRKLRIYGDSVQINITQTEESQMKRNRPKSQFTQRDSQLAERLQKAMRNNTQRAYHTQPLEQIAASLARSRSMITDERYFYDALTWFAEAMETQSLGRHNLRALTKISALEKSYTLNTILDAFDNRNTKPALDVNVWPELREKIESHPEWESIPETMDGEKFMQAMQISIDRFREINTLPNPDTYAWDLLHVWLYLCIEILVDRNIPNARPEFFIFSYGHKFMHQWLECLDAYSFPYVMEYFNENERP